MHKIEAEESSNNNVYAIGYRMMKDFGCNFKRVIRLIRLVHVQVPSAERLF